MRLEDCQILNYAIPALVSGEQFVEKRLNRSRRSPVGQCVIGYTCLLPRGGLVCETVHGFAVDNKLSIYSRMSHLFCECNDVGHRHMRVERSMTD